MNTFVLVVLLTLGNGDEFIAVGDQYDTYDMCQKEACAITDSYHKNPGIVFKDMQTQCVNISEISDEDKVNGTPE